jgi:hypothetical protein
LLLLQLASLCYNTKAMIEVVIVFMELVLMAVGTLAWSAIKAIALVLAALACGTGKVVRPIVDFAVRQVDKLMKYDWDIPDFDVQRMLDVTRQHRSQKLIALNTPKLDNQA